MWCDYFFRQKPSCAMCLIFLKKSLHVLIQPSELHWTFWPKPLFWPNCACYVLIFSTKAFMCYVLNFFEKSLHVLCFFVILVYIYTKITKKTLILKIWPTYPLFAKRKTFRTWQPCSRILHSCLSGIIKKCYQSISCSKKSIELIFRSVWLKVRDLRSF